jgi:hypothetical protein
MQEHEGDKRHVEQEGGGREADARGAVQTERGWFLGVYMGRRSQMFLDTQLRSFHAQGDSRDSWIVFCQKLYILQLTLSGLDQMQVDRSDSLAF